MYGGVNPSAPGGVYSEGETVHFTCQYPETILDRSNSSTCGANGAWEPQPPVCRPCKLELDLIRIRIFTMIMMVKLKYTKGGCS